MNSRIKNVIARPHVADAQVADDVVESKMSGVGKFVEARALDLRLQNALAHGRVILERPPLTEAQKVIIAIMHQSEREMAYVGMSCR